MSKIKLLLDLARDLHSLADSVQAVAEAMEDNEFAETAQPETPVPVKEAEPMVKTVTLEQVRAALADKSQLGFTAQVRILLEKYGAPKLSQIDPANYAALLADAERLK
ncbi:rRNA biogenesis protein rrp5 [Anaeroselena agilis]|uniref:rRNA biogenesis protein rrp5 n=1 Tax=Anaeroselena agilis TaxID=3063788 RepID=A0ABU3NTU3_9FIRM|nr:rRNA biogenesis protein rrp5 [Selenomonadales bacterium 4137-cl]